MTFCCLQILCCPCPKFLANAVSLFVAFEFYVSLVLLDLSLNVVHFSCPLISLCPYFAVLLCFCPSNLDVFCCPPIHLSFNFAVLWRFRPGPLLSSTFDVLNLSCFRSVLSFTSEVCYPEPVLSSTLVVLNLCCPQPLLSSTFVVRDPWFLQPLLS